MAPATVCVTVESSPRFHAFHYPRTSALSSGLSVLCLTLEALHDGHLSFSFTPQHRLKAPQTELRRITKLLAPSRGPAWSCDTPIVSCALAALFLPSDTFTCEGQVSNEAGL